MTASFHSINGYVEPMPLRHFLRRYFFVSLSFDSTATASSSVIVTPPLHEFAVWVYVMVNAPPPPPAQCLQMSHHGQNLSPPPPVISTSTLCCRRPLTAVCLRHAMWEIVFNALGAAAVSFWVRYAPTIAQFACSHGGLQLFGPPLVDSCSPAVKRYRSVAAVARECGERDAKKRRRLEARAKEAKLPVALVALPSKNISRAALWDSTLWPSPTSLRSRFFATLFKKYCSNEKGGVAASSSYNWLQGEGKWFLLRGMVQEGAASRQHGHISSSNYWGLLKEQNCRLVREFVFPWSIPEKGGSANHGNVCADVNGEVAHSGNKLAEHLCNVTTIVMQHVTSANLRGAAIVARRRLQAPEGVTKTDVTTAHATLTMVVDYLFIVLAKMPWPTTAPPPPPADGGKVCHFVSFWGDSEGGGNLRVLLSHVRQWLGFGKRGNFPLHVFLDGISVHSVPWLGGCRILGNPKQRSMMIQRTWMEFIDFFLNVPLPFLVRRVFHVTWSPRSWQHLAFYHLDMWTALRREEIRRLTLCNDSSSCAPQMLGNGENRQPLSLHRANARDVWQRALVSPLGMHMVYSSTTFFPDGKKLRPISTVRFGRGVSLQKLAAKGNDAQLSTRERMRKLQSQRRLELRGQRRRVQWPSPPRAPTPNHSILRQALQCLHCGLSERKVKLGTASVSATSHYEEYSSWRDFAHDCRLRAGEAADATCRLCVVRADASRCFDRLPQESIKALIHSLLPHDSYYFVTFDAVAPQSSDASSECRRKKWSTVLSSESYCGKGTVPGIPHGWIVCEPQGTLPEDTSHPMSNGRRHQHVSVLSGSFLRSVLDDHTTQHFVVLGGALYLQRNGIVQGSAVATLLCDLILEAVDRRLCELLDQYDAPAMLLRRVDDIFLGTLSPPAALHCAASLATGWPEEGFSCNADKMKLVASSALEKVTVKWCGIIVHLLAGDELDSDKEEGKGARRSLMEFSVDWSRLLSDEHRLHATARPLSSNADAMLISLRIMSCIQVRCPMIVLCGQLNSQARVLQSLAEAALIWAHGLVERVGASSLHSRPDVRMLLCPLKMARHYLTALIRSRHEALLKVRGAVDEVFLCEDAVGFILLASLQYTLLTSLRWIVSNLGAKAAGGWTRRFWLLLASIVSERVRVAGEQSTSTSVATIVALFRHNCVLERACETVVESC